ncbi:MAG TPA: hypothetical protein DCQ30_14640 [Acidimicrobiaceae bacterium]|nr:hypothetical protein [Acidimicrobiaceae bacterium]
MFPSIVGTIAGQSPDDEFDDIEQELSCSWREASVGYLPFSSLDLPALASRLHAALGREGRPSERG